MAKKHLMSINSRKALQLFDRFQRKLGYERRKKNKVRGIKQKGDWYILFHDDFKIIRTKYNVLNLYIQMYFRERFISLILRL